MKFLILLSGCLLAQAAWSATVTNSVAVDGIEYTTRIEPLSDKPARAIQSTCRKWKHVDCRISVYVKRHRGQPDTLITTSTNLYAAECPLHGASASGTREVQRKKAAK